MRLRTKTLELKEAGGSIILTGFAWPCRGFGMEANGRRARDWENAFFSRTKACADGGAAALTDEGKTVLVAPDERGEETIGE